ncbi:MAG: TonB-dependent receptor [Sphingomonas sp.]|nr:TonB-dependent receptor [Sphingomonas sp.]
MKQLLGATALAGILVSFPAAAFAQASPTPAQAKDKKPDKSADPKEEAVEEVLVTGSRIPRPEFEGTLPGVQITEKQIKARGFTSVLEILNDQPLIGPGSSPLGTNGGQAASLGASFVDLLDLGTPRTLTLVNGRRFVSGNAATLFVDGNATGGQVDLNSIPASLTERVDVLTVGGAAAYGSDAIAGVVNVTLKRNFEGLSLNLVSGLSTLGDAANYQATATFGKNLLDGRVNLVGAVEYTRNDGLQADSRDFRQLRVSQVVNFRDGSRRNPAFGAAIIDIQGLNNGAFLRASDDGQPSVSDVFGLLNQTISFNGTILNTLGTPPTPYVRNAAGFINLQNGLAPTNIAFFNAGAQIVNGLPGAGLISGNGLNGRAGPIAGLPFTVFAPSSLPTGVTPAQVFAQFGITAPAGASTTQLSALAINVLQANRPTAREFFAQNPNVPINYFLGTFAPGIPRVANLDTTLVTVAGVQVPVNQVLPFVGIPLEFNADGSIRPYTAVTATPGTDFTLAQAPGSNGGFVRALENAVLRVQQDRFIANFNATIEITPGITLFSENLYAVTRTVSLRNSPSQNFLSTGAENSALLVNVNNPYLSAASRAALNSAGINAATRGGSFLISRQNQDIFGDNPNFNDVDTYRFTVGATAKYKLFGRDWTSEVSGTFGRAAQITRNKQIGDIEYQLALDAVDQGLATTGTANGNIVCRSQLFPSQYLGATPNGTVSNLTRQPGAGGVPTELLFTPSITQDLINRCAPLNPFGFNQMSEAAKAYVQQDVRFTNISKQTFLQATTSGQFFDLPAGPLGFAASIEYRREDLNFFSDPLNQLGRGRAAPSAATQGYIEVIEGGAEARIPIFSEKFLGFLGELTLEPAVRVSQQSGAAQTYRNLAGNLVSPRSNGDPQVIYTIGGTWAPIRDIQFRGNFTQAIRQPGVVELFLGGQPAFAAPADPCGPALINTGVTATTRRANCRTALISAGLATDATSADAFLQTFVPIGAALPGTFSGAAGLQPERSTSWTVGAVVRPRWVPGLQLSADYINLDLTGIIQPTNLAQALQFCFDSTTFPNTSPQTGANTCSFFTRDAAFQVAPGFASGYINLSATRLRAWNISGVYNFELPKDFGSITLNGNVYLLQNYTTSAAGTFVDAIESAGTFFRPEVKSQLTARYEKGGFFAQTTWNWQSRTALFVSGVPATIENFVNPRFGEVSRFDVSVGADINDRFRIQAAVFNITDVNYADSNALAQGIFADQIGRSIRVSLGMKF